jgi:hypothetical protein
LLTRSAGFSAPSRSCSRWTSAARTRFIELPADLRHTIRDGDDRANGTRIKAVNNKDRNFTTGSLQKFIEAADKKLEDYLERLDAGDAEERATGGSQVKNLAEKI